MVPIGLATDTHGFELIVVDSELNYFRISNFIFPPYPIYREMIRMMR
jgi:hypothetical protein